MPAVYSLAVILALTPAAEEPINPVPRAVLASTLEEWTFDEDQQGWVAQNACRVNAKDGILNVEATGHDPFFHCGVNFPGGPVALKMRARSRAEGPGVVYWTTSTSPRGEDKTSGFSLKHDGQWHEYVARFVVEGQLTDLRIDPGTERGQFEFDWIQLVHEEPHPLVIEHVAVSNDRVRFRVKNDRPEMLTFDARGEQHSIAGKSSLDLQVPLKARTPIEPIAVEVCSPGLPPVRRHLFVHHPQVKTDDLALPLGEHTLYVARNGSLARIERGGDTVAILAPLVHREGRIPDLKLVQQQPHLRFAGDGIELTLETSGAEISLAIESPSPCTGPVVRTLGDLDQGLFSGLEYLGRGEASSSKLDVETEEHLRFAPDPIKVTLPLMAYVTDKATVAMLWEDTQLQPLYATPNFFDAADDHCMALHGKRITATLRVDQMPLAEVILWATRKHGLPPLPAAPRNEADQLALCLQALNGPLRTEKGWGHCVEERWVRRPYADIASNFWRLTGKVPELPDLVPGGSHVVNESIYFVSGRTQQWLDRKRDLVQHYRRMQKEDGSFRYDGKYRRGHFENTASGVCAKPAADLLEFARITGDATALETGLRTLEYMKRFRTPRGAQVWEVPLHTPDQLASAYLVWAYVRGYELTGDGSYLKEARKWALSGIPFVYLWGEHPVMVYATPPVFGATHWIAPCWIGRPVQWVGGVYAYALTKLAPHDDSLDWNHLARGILIAGEQMQYPEGDNAGLLPDAFVLQDQTRVPANINPCGLLSLRFVLDGRLDALSVATDGKGRVAAPFPVELRNGKAHIQAQAGTDYQVLMDGKTVIDVTSQGHDVVELP